MEGPHPATLRKSRAPPLRHQRHSLLPTDRQQTAPSIPRTILNHPPHQFAARVHAVDLAAASLHRRGAGRADLDVGNDLGSAGGRIGVAHRPRIAAGAASGSSRSVHVLRRWEERSARSKSPRRAPPRELTSENSPSVESVTRRTSSPRLPTRPGGFQHAKSAAIIPSPLPSVPPRVNDPEGWPRGTGPASGGTCVLPLSSRGCSLGALWIGTEGEQA
jgi:hypothetical protein